MQASAENTFYLHWWVGGMTFLDRKGGTKGRNLEINTNVFFYLTLMCLQVIPTQTNTHIPWDSACGHSRGYTFIMINWTWNTTQHLYNVTTILLLKTTNISVQLLQFPPNKASNCSFMGKRYSFQREKLLGPSPIQLSRINAATMQSPTFPYCEEASLAAPQVHYLLASLHSAGKLGRIEPLNS